MVRKLAVILSVAVLALVLAQTADANRGSGALGTVYVTSQGLYYDTFVTARRLPPPHGPFQTLENGVTMWGPGDRDYVGGRWWVDVNGSNQQDEGDRYFLCPLLGPGRPMP